jgi:hypothetical protein
MSAFTFCAICEVLGSTQYTDHHGTGEQDKTSGDRAGFSKHEFNKTRTTNIIPGGDTRLWTR